MTIYSGFTHWKLWFSIVMLVYQRVTDIARRCRKMAKGTQPPKRSTRESSQWSQWRFTFLSFWGLYEIPWDRHRIFRWLDLISRDQWDVLRLHPQNCSQTLPSMPLNSLTGLTTHSKEKNTNGFSMISPVSTEHVRMTFFTHDFRNPKVCGLSPYVYGWNPHF